MDLTTQLCPSAADAYINDPAVELQWAMAAAQKAKIHTELLLSSNTSELKLCKDDDDIISAFRELFPRFDVKQLSVDDLKGDNVAKWRAFCARLEHVRNYNFGSLLRLDAQLSYSDENTVLVPYVIFLAIEIARNREGVNEACKTSVQQDRQSLMEQHAGGDVI